MSTIRLMTRKDRERVALHAGLSTIEHLVKEAEYWHAKTGAYLEFCRDLLKQRQAQIASGEWLSKSCPCEIHDGAAASDNSNTGNRNRKIQAIATEGRVSSE